MSLLKQLSELYQKSQTVRKRVLFKLLKESLHRGSYISAHVLLNLLNELGKRDKMLGKPLYLFFATSLINSVKQEHEC